MGFIGFGVDRAYRACRVCGVLKSGGSKGGGWLGGGPGQQHECTRVSCAIFFA